MIGYINSAQIVRFVCFSLLLFCIFAFGQYGLNQVLFWPYTVSAQEFDSASLSATSTADMQPPALNGVDPKPEDAAGAILSAFDQYEVVAMPASHGLKDLDDFILNLLRNPALPNKVNDICVECGNSLYQPILDRYIAGEDVPLSEVRQVWRNTTQPMCGFASFYEQLFPLIRRINQGLPEGKRLRVLAGDPPIDWSKIQSKEDYLHFLMSRNASIASVMENEVLSKDRKALMLFGTSHLYHCNHGLCGTAVGIFEKNYPGSTMVIENHSGFGVMMPPLAKFNNQYEKRMAFWPVPSIVTQLKGTWLADLLNQTYPSELFSPGDPNVNPKMSQVVPTFDQMIDAYLYLGPRDLLLFESEPAHIHLDEDFMTELRRRASLIGELGMLYDGADPEKVSERGFPALFHNPQDSEQIPFFSKP